MKLIAALLTLFMVSSAYGLDVEGAYRTIPHRQTTYASAKSTLPPKQSEQLAEMFRLVDQALIHRVSTLQWFDSTGSQGQPLSAYKSKMQEIVENLKAIPLPEKADMPRKLILLALKRQQQFFEEREADNSFLGQIVRSLFRTSQSVEDSHNALVQAYNELMSAFPTESSHNKQAFFDHLCALDFI